MRVDRRLLSGLAPVLLEAGFTVEQATAIASSIAAVVDVVGQQHDEKLNEALSLFTDGIKLRQGDAKLSQERDELTRSLLERIEQLEETIHKLMKDR